MHVTVNGTPLQVAEGRLLLDVLADAGMDDLRGIAIAVDGEVVPRSQWAPVVVAEGQRVEVVRAVQGGTR